MHVIWLHVSTSVSVNPLMYFESDRPLDHMQARARLCPDENRAELRLLLDDAA